jgi:transcription antitermination factor NusG
MPILAAEPSLFPEDLLSPTTSPPPIDGAEWRVLHTKPRQEKGLARDLCERGIGFYLPTAARHLPNDRRGRVAELPLFDSYVFLYADRDQYLAALGTKRVIRALPVPDQRGLWADLRRLRTLLAAGLPVSPEVALAPGRLVEIMAGPLAGLRGTIVRAAAGARFVVAVDFIRRGASVTLDGLLLRPVGRAD